MRVCVGAGGRFHIFDLAQELQSSGHLQQLYTGYPGWKLGELKRELVSNRPWALAPAQVISRFNLPGVYDPLNLAAIVDFDRWMARRLEPCDVFHGLSSFATETQRVAREKYGALVVCDRGSSHIEVQDEILAEEFERWGQPYRAIDPGIIERELREYEFADRIVVPSQFAYRSFVQKGVPESRLRLAALGVDLTMFHQVPRRDNVFRILYVGTLSLRKGVPYLLQAIEDIPIPNVEVWFIGAMLPEVRRFLARQADKIRFFGVLPRTKLYQYYSQASVVVLPSLEEGLAMVQAQALACGVPVIGSPHSGAEDLFTDGVEGFITPLRDQEAIRDRILRLYKNPDLQRSMSEAALKRVKTVGGWGAYGARMLEVYAEGLAERKRASNPVLSQPVAETPALPPLSVSISVGGKFHAFHLAEQMAQRGWLNQFFTTYFNPRSNAAGLRIPKRLVTTNVAPELLSRLPSFFSGGERGRWFYRKGEYFDRWASRQLQPCEVFIGWSGFSLKTMRRARDLGATMILVRGSAHISVQKQLLDQESYRFGLGASEVYTGTVEKELQEYQLADYIAMPSRFCERSFVAQGLPHDKLLVWPLGADIRRYSPPGGTRPAMPFRVIYVGEVSLRKGIYYLLEAFHKLSLPNSELVLVGEVSPQVQVLLSRHPARANAMGVVRYPALQKLYHSASVLVLPSIEDGFGQVVLQAMATGLPVVVSENAGASEAVLEGENGFTFPVRDTERLAKHLECLYRDPDLRRHMGEVALRSAVQYNWNNYGAVVESSLLRIREARHA